jgi:hypothetical protein
MSIVRRNFAILTHLCQEAKKENHDLNDLNSKLRRENRQLKIDIESLKAKVTLLGAASHELHKEKVIIIHYF